MEETQNMEETQIIESKKEFKPIWVERGADRPVLRFVVEEFNNNLLLSMSPEPTRWESLPYGEICSRDKVFETEAAALENQIKEIKKRLEELSSGEF